ncbi:MAG: phosphatase PAP2 family protein [Chitinophagaceae bacterium]
MFFLASSFLQKLEQWDQWLFTKVNNDLTNPFFDYLFPVMRASRNWAPLYLFFVVFAIANFKIKGLWWVVLLAVTVALTDMSGNYLFKKMFERPRPCSDPDFFMHVRLLVNHCSYGFSFVSNHAANHFGVATFFLVTMRPIFKKWTAIALIWAGLISYAQIYVGVHYPFDVLAGALLGLTLGACTGRLFNKRYGFTIFDNKPTTSS